MPRRALLIAGLALALAPALAFAQPQEPDIVVTGRRAEEVHAFVGEISATPQGANQLGVWERDICPSVTGLSREQGQLIVDRISMRAAAVGLRFGDPGCSANVFIFFAADANAFAQRLFEDRREMFAYHRTSAEATRGRAALDSFLNDPRPVRWWHVMQFVGADGDRIGDNEARSTSPRPPPPESVGQPPEADGFADMQAVRGRASRLRSAQRLDFARAVIIVEGTAVAQTPLNALGDYLAMVTLAQIDPVAQPTSVPTILSLFSATEERPTALTSWDIAYLDGLYRAPRDAASASQQISDITRRMTENAH